MAGIATACAEATEVTGQQLSVAVCAEERSRGERVCAALAAGGHAVLACNAIVEGLLASCTGSAPTCVVVVADRPDRSAIGTVRQIRSKLERVAAVLVCRSARGPEVRRALELGVDGVVLNEDVEEVLGAVVAVVCAGQVSVPGGRRGDVMMRALTTREKQVLALLIRGMTNAQIADKLFLAESTVKSHLSSAFSKLGVSTRYEAATVILDPERGSGWGIRQIGSDRSALQPTGRMTADVRSSGRLDEDKKKAYRRIPV
jgi:two-component system, NarL family, response regulator DesR